ncbi:MAG: acetylxylan esterase, partial [Planctomycetota bacterium]
REFAGYTFCYNDTLLARRVHDVLSLIAFIRGDGRTESLALVATDGAGPWASLAASVAGKTIDRRIIDTGAFRFAKLRSYRDVNFLPGAVKYGDLPGMLSLSAPRSLTIVGDGIAPIVRKAYAASGAANKVRRMTLSKALSTLLD